MVVPNRWVHFRTSPKNTPALPDQTPPAKQFKGIPDPSEAQVCSPQEAIDNLTPNPYARHRLGSSRTLTEFVTPGPSRELPEYVALETRSAVSVKRGRAEGFLKRVVQREGSEEGWREGNTWL